MKSLKLLLGAIAMGSMLFMFSCVKTAGLGGKAHIHGSVNHDDQPVDGAEVHIWYDRAYVGNTHEGYDNEVTTNANGEFEFENLNPGDYFLHFQWTNPDDGNTMRTDESVRIREKDEEAEVHAHFH